MFAIEVDYLTGVVVATAVDERGRAEWPPHPDRLFSALVDGWAHAGEDADEAAALRWLETLPAPWVQATEAHRREVVDVFVPPNDAATSGRVGASIPKDLAAAVRVVPMLRKNRQPRQFSAVLPHGSTVRFAWPEAEATAHEAALARLVDRLVALGHSASLVRARLVEGLDDAAPIWRPLADDEDQPPATSLRWVYPGRLERLGWWYGQSLRPNPGETVPYVRHDDPTPLAATSVFGEDWIVFADDGGTAPALTAFPLVAQRFRDALLSVAEEPMPAELSGHEAEGSPTRRPHLAFVPLADVGYRYSEGRLFGLACVLPRALEVDRASEAHRRIRIAIGRLTGRHGVCLKLGRLGVWRLRRESEPARASLDPRRYLATASRWSSATPLALDRFPKPEKGEMAEAIIAQACVNAGLPAPIDVAVHKHAAFTGAASARPAGRSPAWADWAFPASSALADRPRTHATLTFAAAVRGPVLVGAGRFRGLGLCLPAEVQP